MINSFNLTTISYFLLYFIILQCLTNTIYQTSSSTSVFVTVKGSLIKHARLDTCSYQKTKEARSQLKHTFHDKLKETNNFEVDQSTCPFHEDNDYLLPHMDIMQQQVSRWKCKLCNKKKKTFDEMVDHMKLKHADLLDESGLKVCLADYCDMLQCESFVQSISSAASLCNPSEMEIRKFKCKKIIKNCFPDRLGIEVRQLHEYFDDLYCESLTCDFHKRNQGQYDMELAKTARKWDILFILKWVLFLVIAIFIVVCYAGVYLWNREFSFKDDLRRLSKPRNFSIWKKSKSKAF